MANDNNKPRPLAPLTPKQIKKRAKRTVNAAYRPDLKASRKQLKRESGVYKKRQADLHYYKEWLTRRQRDWNRQSAEADAALRDSMTQSVLDMADRGEQNQQDMIEGAPAGPSDMSGYTGFNTADLVDSRTDRQEALKRMADQQIASNLDMRKAVQANSRNFLAGLAATAASEHRERLNTIFDTRDKLFTERRRDRIAEEARLLDKEIEKAQIRADIRLKKKELALRKLAITIDDQNADADRAAAAAENNGNGNGNGGDEVDLRARKKITREINANISNGLEAIKGDKVLQDLVADGHTRETSAGRIRLQKAIIKRVGIPADQARAVVQIYYSGGIGPGLKKVLKQQGYIVPKSWR